jgi:hypothetical protein
MALHGLASSRATDNMQTHSRAKIENFALSKKHNRDVALSNFPLFCTNFMGDWRYGRQKALLERVASVIVG